MANPKRRHTRSRRDMRRASNWRLEIPALTHCPQCHAAKRTHHICPSCGFYDGQLLRPVKEKKKGKESPEAEG
ncbi:MAG: 50S ribosomal protein L32 [Elusimicrobia bacterium]|nr:50S ribosomal protein L32 [Elusimicrobiota bacterium]